MISSLLIFVILNIYCRRKKVEAVPPIKLFCVAVLAGVPSVIASMFLGNAVKLLCADPLMQKYGEADLRYLFADNFLVAGLVEEFVKMAAFLLVLLILRKQHKPVQVILLMLSIGIGFDVFEDIVFLLNGVDLFRLCMPGHLVFGGIMGLLFVRAMQTGAAGNRSRAVLLYVLSYVLPFLCHGLYDFCVNLPWKSFSVFVVFPLMMISTAIVIWYFVALVKEEAAKLPEPTTE